MTRSGVRWPRLLAALTFGLAGLLVPSAWFLPVIARDHNVHSFVLFLGLPGIAAAAAGALLGRPLAASSRGPSGGWAALRGAVIATVALVLFAPMFAAAIWWTEPGWTNVFGLTVLVLWFGFIATWWTLAAVGAVVGWALYRWAAGAPREATE